MLTAPAAAPPRPRPAVAPIKDGLPPWRLRAVALVVFTGTFVYRSLSPGFSNDHFRTLSEARQIIGGEVPFRDFVDPGTFGQLYASAAMQWLFGYNLLGEVILCVSLLSASAVLTFWLASRAARSLAIGFVLTILAVALHARLNAYPKLFFPMLGLFLCWRYADRATTPNLILLALCTATAFLFRHDHGVYVAMATAATLAIRHREDGRLMLGRAGLHAGLVAVALLPFFVFLEANGGIVEYFRSSIEYAREESRRAGPFPHPELVVTGGIFRRENAEAFLYYLFVALPPIALVILLVKRWSRPPARAMPFETTKILGAAIVCAVTGQVFLRDPLDVRLPDVAGSAAVLGAWLLGQWLVGRRSPLRARSRSLVARPNVASAGRLALAAGPPLLRFAGAAVLLGLTAMSVATTGRPDRTLAAGGILDGPSGVMSRATRTIGELQVSPGVERNAPASRIWPLARYVNQCTTPSDRLLVTHFEPDFYFFSGRRFAGDQLFWFSEYRSSPSDQQRTLTRIQAQSVPVVITDGARYDRFASDYPLIHEYLAAHYNGAQERRFGGELYRILLDRRQAPKGRYRPLELPCFR